LKDKGDRFLLASNYCASSKWKNVQQQTSEHITTVAKQNLCN